MLYVNERDNRIRLTRGDTAYLTVPIKNDITGAAYELASGDTLKLTIKKSIKDLQPTIQKVKIGSNSFHIEPKDTASRPIGEYKYDVQLTRANGDVYTVIADAVFELMPEVTT